MPFLHFYNSLRLLITYLKLSLLRLKWPLVFIKLFILFYLPFNTALAGEIFSTGFESGSLSKGQNGFSWTDSTWTSVSNSNSKSGNYSLKFRFQAAGGDNKQGDDSWAEQRFNLGNYYPDIWIKYDLYIPYNYNHRDASGPDNNKGLSMLWTGSYNQPREGTKLATIFLPRRSDGGSEIILYAGGRINGEKHIDLAWHCEACGGDGKSSRFLTENDKGHWMTVVIHNKYATEASYLAALAADGSYDLGDGDGVAEVWKTDWEGKTTKLIDIHDGHWYSTQIDSTEPARGFDTGYLLGWANSGFDEETILYIDNITFSTTPLINNDSVSTDIVASPKPPRIIFN